MPRTRWPPIWRVRTIATMSPWIASQIPSGTSAKAERKNTTSPVGIAPPSAFTLAIIKVAQRVAPTLRPMPISWFMSA